MDYQGAKQISQFLGAISLFWASCWAPAAAQQGPAFDLPMNCSGDTPCFVQNLVDMDKGPRLRDPFCHAATFNKHKGTDIRLPRIADMRQWGDILAMADGVVTATRDSQPDRLMESQADRKRIRGRECGNGVAINHGRIDGRTYTAQYCHMENGSIVVNPGERVKRGQKIGLMGLSGATEFPHIHVSVRRDGIVVDPFTGSPAGTRCKAADTSGSLFSADALKRLQNGGFQHLLEDGFAGGQVNGKQVLKGTYKRPTLSSPLVYFAKYINLRKGDFIRLSITGPGGEYARSQTKPLDRKKSTYTAYVGRKRPPKPGIYRGQAELIRNGRVIHSHKSKLKSL
ncbi:MAG: M23 family metallopeptidase [Rhizobiaceae bacterium]